MNQRGSRDLDGELGHVPARLVGPVFLDGFPDGFVCIIHTDTEREREIESISTICVWNWGWDRRGKKRVPGMRVSHTGRLMTQSAFRSVGIAL